jgi:hypothetical protein
MTITVDGEQTQILRDILEGTLIQLRIESARADMHDFRELLHHRERAVEKLLDQIPPVKSQPS